MAAATSSDAASRHRVRVCSFAAADAAAEAAPLFLRAVPGAAVCVHAAPTVAETAPAGVTSAAAFSPALGAAACSPRRLAGCRPTSFDLALYTSCNMQLPANSSALRPPAPAATLRPPGAGTLRPRAGAATHRARAAAATFRPLAAAAARRLLPAATAGHSFACLCASSASAAAASCTAHLSPFFSSLPAAAADCLQQRGYRHWARHRAFEKVRRLPNRALRPGCCAASLFPPPTNSYSTTYNRRRSSSSPAFCSSSTSSGSVARESAALGSSGSPSASYSSPLHGDSATYIRSGSDNNSTFSGFLSPNITGSIAVHGDYRVARTAGGGYRLVPPYPPRVNKTIEPYPPSAPKYFTVNRSYPLQWRNVEYKYVPVRLPRPYGAAAAAAAGEGGGTIAGQTGAAWGGEIIRIFHKRKGWTKGKKNGK